VHWVLDVVFGDDYQRLRSDYGPRNMALVQRIALNLMIRRRPSAMQGGIFYDSMAKRFYPSFIMWLKAFLMMCHERR
jgi:hypothetical protein